MRRDGPSEEAMLAFELKEKTNKSTEEKNKNNKPQ